MSFSKVGGSPLVPQSRPEGAGNFGSTGKLGERSVKDLTDDQPIVPPSYMKNIVGANNPSSKTEDSSSKVGHKSVTHLKAPTHPELPESGSVAYDVGNGVTIFCNLVTNTAKVKITRPGSTEGGELANIDIKKELDPGDSPDRWIAVGKPPTLYMGVHDFTAELVEKSGSLPPDLYNILEKHDFQHEISEFIPPPSTPPPPLPNAVNKPVIQGGPPKKPLPKPQPKIPQPQGPTPALVGGVASPPPPMNPAPVLPCTTYTLGTKAALVWNPNDKTVDIMMAGNKNLPIPFLRVTAKTQLNSQDKKEDWIQVGNPPKLYIDKSNFESCLSGMEDLFSNNPTVLQEVRQATASFVENARTEVSEEQNADAATEIFVDNGNIQIGRSSAEGFTAYELQPNMAVICDYSKGTAVVVIGEKDSITKFRDIPMKPKLDVGDKRGEWLEVGQPPVAYLNKASLDTTVESQGSDSKQRYGKADVLRKQQNRFIKACLSMRPKQLKHSSEKLSGAVINAKLEIERGKKLGEGGFKTVGQFGARWVRGKTIHQTESEDSKTQKAFKEEAQTSQELRRRRLFQSGVRHIMDVRPAIRTNKLKSGVVMPFAQGGELSGLCPTVPINSKNNPTEYKRNIRAARQVAETCYDLCKQGRSFCDLKKENVLLDEKGNVTFGDLGSVTKIGEVPSGITFFSPDGIEKAVNSDGIMRASESLDVWAFGILLYELFDTTIPGGFRGTEAEKIKKSAETLVQGLDGTPVNSLIKKALSSNPKERPSMKEMLAELERIEKSLP